MNLFDFTSAYPNHPGFKNNETSREAAEKVAETAPKLRLQCLGMLHYHGPMTADEIAAKLERDKLSIRPRITELAHKGKIKPTGERRKNESGCTAKVWEIA